MVSALSIGELQSLKRQVEQAGLHLQVSTGVLGLAPDRFTKTTLAHENLLYLERPSKLARSTALKRALDVVVAGAGLLFALPVLLVAALAIRHEDRGPIFFHQMRVGRDGRLFRLHKLRSMGPDAEALKAKIAEQNARKGPLFKAVADPRITRIGRILRATSIDEIPQLWNVLRGEMSLVGPRPALPEEVEQFDLELLARHSVQPGVTGLWQVEGREAASFDSYKQLDLHYVENWSILLDLTIIIETLGSLIGRTLRTLFKFRKDGEIAA
jgi:lipopolysaccharide/colanic/teichoic acid biosynthesis glycosyltransferase